MPLKEGNTWAKLFFKSKSKVKEAQECQLNVLVTISFIINNNLVLVPSCTVCQFLILSNFV